MVARIVKELPKAAAERLRARSTKVGRDTRRHRSVGIKVRATVFAIVLALCLNACRSSTGPSAASMLRVTNVGSRGLEGLVVLFPDDRIEFSSVPAGVTTSYHVARNGVFRYAAYEFRVGGRVQLQPVIDWVGEQPMEGHAFTYSLELVEGPSGVTIRLVSTHREY